MLFAAKNIRHILYWWKYRCSPMQSSTVPSCTVLMPEEAPKQHGAGCPVQAVVTVYACSMIWSCMQTKILHAWF
jgi:hypothetical protein